MKVHHPKRHDLPQEPHRRRSIVEARELRQKVAQLAPGVLDELFRPEKNEQIWASRLEYNTEEKKGKFWDVRGETHPRIVAGPES